jgi:hypothetical protein
MHSYLTAISLQRIAEDLPRPGGDLTGVIHRQKQSILDIEGAIEAEIKKQGESMHVFQGGRLITLYFF